MRTFCLAVAAVLLAVFVFPALAEDNLLKNPSFEDGDVGKIPPAWSQHAYDGKDSSLKAPYAVAPAGHTGNCTAVDLPPGYQWTLIEQYINVPPDPSKGLALSAWLRSDDPEGKVELVILVSAPKRKAYDVAHVRARFADIGPEWKKYEVALSLADAVGLKSDDELIARAIIQVYAPHQRVYVDDVSFSLIDAEGALYQGVPEKFRPGLVDRVMEATPITLKDGRVALFFQKGGSAAYRLSNDAGRTWGSIVPCELASGGVIKTGDCMPVRLRSGRLGLALHAKYKLSFSVSDDEGKTWSDPVAINPGGPGGKPLNGAPFVTKTGRVVLPVWHIPPDAPKLWRKPGFAATICWLSDDEGKTWHPGGMIVSEQDDVKSAFEEAVGVQLKDGRLLLFGRTPMARLFKSYSSDNGETWTKPVPTPLVASYAPCALGRMPDGNLLCIWNQSSIDEVRDPCPMRRHRLTCAVSSDEGETWQHFRNLEALDDTVKIEDKVNWDVFSFGHEEPYKQPTDKAKYPHAPGPLRCAYPAVAFTKSRAVIAYDYGSAEGLFPGHFLKVVSLPYSWFYEKQ